VTVESYSFGPSRALVYRPPEARGRLILFHGYGADEMDLFNMRYDLPRTWSLFSVRGFLPLPWGGFAWFPVEIEAGEGVHFNPEHILASTYKILQVCEAIAEWDSFTGPTVLGGFSQGSAMAMMGLLLAPEKFAGALMMSGAAPPEMNAISIEPQKLAGKRVFVGHGQHDTLLPVKHGRLIREFWEQYPVDLIYREYPVDHGIHPEELRDITGWLSAIR